MKQNKASSRQKLGKWRSKKEEEKDATSCVA